MVHEHVIFWRQREGFPAVLNSSLHIIMYKKLQGKAGRAGLHSTLALGRKLALTD